MKIAILGRTRWLLDSARALVAAGHRIVCVATAPAESYYGCGTEEFAALAREAGAEFLGVVSLNDAGVLERLQAAGADLAVSINWPTILSASVIGKFPQGVINAHCGDLPRYRGNACPNWAILNGESHIGLCVHMMEPDNVDSGAVLLRDSLPIGSETYITDVYAWLDRRIPSLTAEAVTGLATAKLTPVPQPTDPAAALRCYPRRPEDGRIDWRAPAETPYKLVRATSRPFEGAFTFSEDGTRITVWRARPFAHPTSFCAVPGQIMLRYDGDPVVACGTGALRLEEVAIEGIDPAEAKSALGRSVRARLL